MRKICYNTLLILLLLCSCNSDKGAKESIELFDLKAYLKTVEEDWQKYNQSVYKHYVSGIQPRESENIAPESIPNVVRIFEKYDINKPDYADKYQKYSAGGVITFTAIHKRPKVKTLTVFKSSGSTKPDSVLIKFIHESVIGQSEHMVRINPQEMQLKRSEKYLFSDSLKTIFTLKAGE